MPEIPLAPYWQTTDRKTVKFYLGHVIDVLARLPAGSVQCVITSPPYWGLRDYGTGTWEGGNPNCDHRAEHRVAPEMVRYLDSRGHAGNHNTHWKGGSKHSSVMASKVCKKCGAVRHQDYQIGSEARPDCLGWARGENCAEGEGWATACHVCRMVLVFRGVRRVLRDDGTAWLNYGDSYAGLSSGNLAGIPWRVAFALQADGWVLRQDIIWHKPSPMPESVYNRCTKSHEYLFLLTKRGGGYFYDAEAIRQPLSYDSSHRRPVARTLGGMGQSSKGLAEGGEDRFMESNPNGSNKRSVWTISAEPYSGAHFAVFPKKLVEPCLLAGTSARGACVKCGAPWRRVVTSSVVWRGRSNAHVKYAARSDREYDAGGPSGQPDQRKAGVETTTLGWYPTCDCDGAPSLPRRPLAGKGYTTHPKGGKGDHFRDKVDDRVRLAGINSNPDYPAWKESVAELCRSVATTPTRPCVVLDPFIGSGTVAVVALEHGRRCLGIDLSEEYLRDNAIQRTSGVLLGRPAWRGLVPSAEGGSSAPTISGVVVAQRGLPSILPHVG